MELLHFFERKPTLQASWCLAAIASSHKFSPCSSFRRPLHGRVFGPMTSLHCDVDLERLFGGRPSRLKKGFFKKEKSKV